MVTNPDFVIAATRVMATFLAIAKECGNAVAAAAVVVVENNINVSELKGEEIKKVLELKGAIIL